MKIKIKLDDICFYINILKIENVEDVLILHLLGEEDEHIVLIISKGYIKG
jgi:hypothetical protein